MVVGTGGLLLSWLGIGWCMTGPNDGSLSFGPVCAFCACGVVVGCCSGGGRICNDNIVSIVPKRIYKKRTRGRDASRLKPSCPRCPAAADTAAFVFAIFIVYVVVIVGFVVVDVFATVVVAVGGSNMSQATDVD